MHRLAFFESFFTGAVPGPGGTVGTPWPRVLLRTFAACSRTRRRALLEDRRIAEPEEDPVGLYITGRDQTRAAGRPPVHYDSCSSYRGASCPSVGRDGERRHSRVVPRAEQVAVGA